MVNTDTRILLLHGFWHGSWCWSEVIPRLAALDRTAVAVDMAGHGLRARRPAWATRRPFDPAALGTEISPVSDIDLDEAGDLLVAQIEQLGRGAPVTVVAHSMGGTVLTRAAEQAPDLVAHAVYLAAMMPMSDTPILSYTQLPENAGSLAPALVRADPGVVGATRIDTGSPDPEYRDRLRQTFYGDVEPIVADAAIALLTPDAPYRFARETTTLTRNGWGSIPRTYVVCTRDNAVPVALQRKLIADADSAFPDNPTTTVTLDASHSPFFSMPDQVTDIITRSSVVTGSVLPDETVA